MHVPWAKTPLDQSQCNPSPTLVAEGPGQCTSSRRGCCFGSLWSEDAAGEEHLRLPSSRGDCATVHGTWNLAPRRAEELDAGLGMCS